MSSSQKKILLAEDDASMRNFLTLTLTRAGFEVAAAEDGLAAMELALKEDFDAVVADDVMPNMTGHDLCRMLRGNSQTESTPFIILSGMESSLAETSETKLANAYLLKTPNLKDDLILILSELLQPAEVEAA